MEDKISMTTLCIKVLVRFFLRLFGKNKLSILTYHRVGQSGNAIAMNEALFEQHLIWIKRYFNPISLDDGFALQSSGDLPRGAVAITVDDGYADIYSTIFPLLKKHDLKAAFFISTSGYEKGYLWDERIAFIIMNTELKSIHFEGENYPLLTENDKLACLVSCQNKIKYKTLNEREVLIEQLALAAKQITTPQQFITKEQTITLNDAGMCIGAHTHTHPILLKESDEVAFFEIQQSKKLLEDVINKPIKYFAYPNGKFGIDFNAAHIEMVKKSGFLAALSTDKGILKDQSNDGFKIKRFTPWDTTELKFVLRLVINYCQ